MNFLKPFFLFLVINFTALAIGSRIMGNKASSEWYLNLNKAPWSPEGWVFGVAWTVVMLTFAAYMAFLFNNEVNRVVLWILFCIQLALNLSWNYIFFEQQLPKLGVIILLSLTIVIGIMLIKYYRTLDLKGLFILPYLIWSMIATSLNLYIVLKN